MLCTVFTFASKTLSWLNISFDPFNDNEQHASTRLLILFKHWDKAVAPSSETSFWLRSKLLI